MTKPSPIRLIVSGAISPQRASVAMQDLDKHGKPAGYGHRT
jgi:hypothetical protein